MRTIIKLLVLISFLLTLETVIAQKTWTGTTSTAWNTSTNWSPAGAPASSDDVIIPSAPANQPVVSGTSTPVCKNLTINSGASLSISATTSNNALLTASGNATINGALSIGGAIGKTGKLIAVNVTWGSTGSMSGFLGGSIETSGTWEFSAGSAISMGLCSVTFTGSSNTLIVSKSSNSSFSSVTISKTGSATLSISATSTSTLKFGGTVTISSGASLLGLANITTIFSGNLNNSGHFSFINGTQSFEKTSGTQTIQVNSGDVFYNLTINAGGTVTINNTLTVQDNVTIQAGVFDPQGNAVIVFGDWANAVGPDGFVEGTGKVTFSGGNYHQYCTNETFNILEVHKTIGGEFRVSGATVTCAQYDWTAGSVGVLGNGTFTALDLADDGIRGNYSVNTGCTINLYQDNYQYVDLGGNLTFTSGGTINVYGGMGYSQWPNFANASITMNGGTLDFVDNGISINNSGTYTLTTNISGGTIRTSKDFYCERADYHPTGGTILLYGSTDCQLSFTAGTIRSLYINKNTASTVTLGANTAVTSLFNINSGKLYAVNKVITPSNDVTINSGGILHLGMAAQLKMANGKNISIENGGILKTDGTLADNAIITHNATGFYFIYVKNGGTLSANNTYFSYLSYIQFQNGSTLDPANAFYRCTFTNNLANPSGGVIYFNNDQEVSVYQTNFTALNSGYNVYKSNDTGHISFKDATGAFSGATYEYDPYNRIDWVASTPGLWTGITSSDWSTAGNWDDYNVPTLTTDVTIPAGTPFSPVISSGTTNCHDLWIQENALLTQNTGTTINCYGDFGIFGYSNGPIIMDGTSYLFFRGSENTQWHSFLESVYSNVRIQKSISTASVKYSDLVANCTGTFEIKEGVFELNAELIIESSSINAFIVEDGGSLIGNTPIFQEVVVNGSIHFYNGSFISPEYLLISVGGDFIVDSGASGNNFDINFRGTGDQYFNNQSQEFEIRSFDIDKPSGTCYLQSDLKTIWCGIYSGVLSCDNGLYPSNTFDIYTSSWMNLADEAAFNASTGKVHFYDGTDYGCTGSTIFNILEVNRLTPLHVWDGNIVCSVYDWIQGGIEVVYMSTIFTANDLLDNAIKGTFICEEGGTINLTNSGTGTFVDLAGELYNYGGTINISGSISYWPYGGNAVVEMTGGVIDLKTCGLTINNNPTLILTDNITGGTIRTAYGFAGNRADFTPTMGTFEFYGSTDANISQSNGCSLPNVLINKSAKEGEKSAGGEPIFDVRTGELLSDGGKANMISLTTPFSITNDLTIQTGVLKTNNNTINISGDWNNTAGPDGFIEGTGRVIFAGNQAQMCSSEAFYTLEINKPSEHLYNYSNATISCQVYDWTQGGIWISSNGYFSAADLADNGIYGNWTLSGTSIELHQDAAQAVDLIGNLTINGGEFKVYGENLDWSRWGSVGNTMLTMTGGTLEFGVNNGIYISDFAPYAFTSNITGGTIRTRDFYSLSPGFVPSGGTVEKSGEGYGEVHAYNGSYFHNLKINTSEHSTRIFSCDIINDLTIEGTTVFSGGNSLQCGNVIINNGGTLLFEDGILKMKNNGSININSGGYFYFIGDWVTPSKVTGINPADRYSFDANSGSWMSASYTEFENMDQDGIYIHPGALVKLSPAFQNCVFSNGAAGGTLLNINNNQDLFIENAVFPANTWWGQYNVMKNINAGQVFFSNATGAFSGAAYESDPFNRIFWAGQPDEQTVILPEGWSGLSTWLLPLPEDDVADLLAPILSDFTILLNNTGGMYYPASGINTIGKWASQSAFKLKMENEASLTLEGGWELNKTFALSAGWNLMPVIFNDVWDAPLAAMQLEEKLVIIKEVAGTKVYWPQYGIQTLYWLQPGSAYYVKMNSAGSLTFPPNDVKGTSAIAQEKYKPQSPWGIVNATGTSHIIAVPANLLAAFAVGDVIGVFTTEGVCVGFEEIKNPAESMAITAWGDDPTTLHKAGFEIGEKMTLRLSKRMTKTIGDLDVTWDTQLPDEGCFVTDGISALKEMKLVSTGIVQENSGIYVYPNPTDGIIKIYSPEEIKEIVLTNPEGAVIMHLNAGSSVDFEADLTTLPSGIYQVRIITSEGVVVRKVIRK